METVRATGKDGKAVIIDRVGAENGNYFSPMKPDGTPYSLKERAIGDYLPYEKLEDNASYHQYKVEKDFTRANFEKAIIETYDDVDIITEKLAALDMYYRNASMDTHTGGMHDGEAYCLCDESVADGVKTGEIDQMFTKEGDRYMKGTDGGGIQYITPFNVNELIEMGMIKKIF